MNRWQKISLSIVSVMAVIVLIILLLDPFPKFIRNQINQSVTDIGIQGREVEKVETLEVDGIPLRIYQGHWETSPTIFYVPGGAFIAGNLDTHDNICRYLAAELGAVVISVDYHKAPEHPFPAGLNDARNMLTWWLDHGEDHKADVSRLLLMGDSGGANMVATLAQEFSREITGQILINPPMDLRESSIAYEYMSMFVNWYLADIEDANKPEASPIIADSFDDLPPTLIVTCEDDPLEEDGVAYQQQLEAAGVSVELREFPGLGHLAALWAGTAPETQEIQEFVVDRAAAMLAQQSSSSPTR